MFELAHPLTAPREVVAPPLLLALLAFGVVLLASRLAVRTGGATTAATDDGLDRLDRLDRPLTGAERVTRGLALVLFVLAVVAGVVGTDDQLRTILPVALVAIGWPLLVLVEALIGGVFARINPWDTVGRLLEPWGAGRGERRHDVRPAAVVALLWVWYLTVPGRALDPRNVALVFGGYTFVTLAGMLALGRRTWLTSAELFTVLFGWVTRARRGGLVGWEAPRGMRLVLSALLGGLLAGQLRDTHVYDALRTTTWSVLWQTLSLVAVCAVVLLLLRTLEPGEARAGAAAASAVWSVVGLALALALARNRLTTAVQLVPVAVSDPLGLGWDLLGTAGPRPIRVPVLSEAVRVWTQVGLVTAGGVAGAGVIARAYRDAPNRRATTVTGVALLTWLGVLAFTSI